MLRLEEYDGHDDMGAGCCSTRSVAVQARVGRQREHMLVAVTVTTVTNIATVTFPYPTLLFMVNGKCPWLPKSTKKLRRAVSACFLKQKEKRSL